MSTITESTGRAVRLSTRNKVGLVLAGLLGLSDITSLVTTPHGDDASGQTGPPTGILIIDTVLGLITVIAVIMMWRTGSRAAGRIVAGSRILSIITALPAFFVGGVAAGLVLLVSVFVIITAITVYLVLSKPADAPA